MSVAQFVHALNIEGGVAQPLDEIHSNLRIRKFTPFRAGKHAVLRVVDTCI